MISTEIWSKEIMDENLVEAYDQAEHLARQAHCTGEFTVNHMMLSLLDQTILHKIFHRFPQKYLWVLAKILQRVPMRHTLKIENHWNIFVGYSKKSNPQQ